MERKKLGETLIQILESFGVEIIFGIPGVHTVELYRALSQSRIRHITARHEQGVGFMADGYARLSGKPGVCFVITGPGVTNILTSMAQARAESIPMLVISGVNDLKKDKKKKAPLHDLPNQAKLVKQVALATYTLKKPKKIKMVLQKAFTKMTSGRPGPVHIQIPIDVMTKNIDKTIKNSTQIKKEWVIKSSKFLRAFNIIRDSKNPCVIIGGGARSAKIIIAKFIEMLDAPTISTVNARDLLGVHKLHIPASPSLKSVREVIKQADLVIALGTEMGQTDYDMFDNNSFPCIKNLIRIDIDKNQLQKSPIGTLKIKCDVKQFCESALQNIDIKNDNINKKELINHCMEAIQLELSEQYGSCQLLISTIVETLPSAILVGDSTQPTYFGNLLCEITNQNRWFNSATGYGTLGYAPPAAIGAKLACPEKPVICIVGDGGLQFSIAELGTAVDELVPVLFLVWNNSEYKEIRTYMESQGITPIGTLLTPPNLELTAKSYGLKFNRTKTSEDLSRLLLDFEKNPIAMVVEVIEKQFKK